MIHEIGQKTGQRQQWETCRQTVDTVYQIDGVVDEHDDKHRQRDTYPIGCLVDAKQTV